MQGLVIRRVSSAEAESSNDNTWSHINCACLSRESSVNFVIPLGGTIVCENDISLVLYYINYTIYDLFNNKFKLLEAYWADPHNWD